jgi:hypothetical protein
MTTADIPEIVRVRTVRAIDGARIAVTFSNGASGVADLSALLAQSGSMLEPLCDPLFFARVFVESGAPTWPNGYDLDPSALHDRMRLSGELAAPAAAE